MKKRILCFGDSNTWGYAPGGARYDESVRWPTTMARMLGDEYTVIEEGLCGRTTVLDDPTEGGFRSGANYLPPCLMSHNPLDLVIILLGTNDTKVRFNMTSYNIAQGMEQLIKLVNIHGQDREAKTPRLLIVSPVPNGDNLMETLMGPLFGRVSVGTSRALAEEYRKLALMHKVAFLDAGTLTEVSPLDAIHLSSEGQQALARGIAAKVKKIFGE